MKKAVAYILLIALFVFGAAVFGACADTDGAPSSDPTDESLSGSDNGQERAGMIYINVNGTVLEVELIDNQATRVLVETLQKGNVTVALQKNGGFEQYGDLGFSLPASDSHLTAQCGDVFLYNARYLCLFYSESSWSYTGLGRVVNRDRSEIENLLSGNDVTVTLSLTESGGEK